MGGVRRTVPILRSFFRLLPLAAPHKATIGHFSGGSKGAVTTACIFFSQWQPEHYLLRWKGRKKRF
jgi:hypothetical protein